ncbi:ROK family protein [Rhodococcus sp. IEGM 1330]|uniref:ROK family protein n=1 Tax=Rhodococcus sp. IEGM 1330 TaxID=3082225 RepID=UPI002952CE0C|nr:ROK family protein [Rhodococcus sp. IEGM 1330]MDV8023772.1 ROK family protein [Rhodococcus sp. IEGM 1330]
MTAAVSVDLGGTWLRIRSGDVIERVPSPSALRQPGVAADNLLQQLMDTLDRHAPHGAAVNISCGAALDEQNGVALGSGPLWGGAPTGEIPLLSMLSSRRPDVHWRLVNDVTAGLASFALGFARPTDRHIAYFTISSGIAARTAILTDRSIPVDHRGLQGEVGHLRASTSAPEAVRTLPCACGGIGHVSSISSGPAVQAVADVLEIRYDVDTFASSLAAGDPDSSRLLRTVVEPIAELIRTMIALDPRLDRIGIGGGVAEGLWEFYERELTGQLAETRSYADSLTPERVADIIHLCRPGDIDTLAGADAIADGFLRVTKI